MAVRIDEKSFISEKVVSLSEDRSVLGGFLMSRGTHKSPMQGKGGIFCLTNRFKSYIVSYYI